MSAEEKIEKIAQIDGSVAAKAPELERIPPNRELFETLLQKQSPEETAKVAPETTTKIPVTTESTNASPISTIRDLNYITPAKAVSLVSQTQEALIQIDKIKKTLEGPNVSVKRSAQQLLQNKLQHIDESLKIALSKAGVEYQLPAIGEVSEQKTPTRVNPIDRFLGFLTDGQSQLERLGGELENMSAHSKELSPVNMLAIQVKVNMIQQELELFSSLLGKGLESVKTIMNIQV
jgi:hypothetical protein